jgi:hypothetical protein
VSDNLCGMCGIREATWPEATNFGGGFDTISIWCQPCADKVIAEATLEGHVVGCDKCRFTDEDSYRPVPVAVCDEGKVLYEAYRKASDLADDAE